MDTNVVISHATTDGEEEGERKLRALSWASLEDRNAIKRFVNVVRLRVASF